MNVILNLDPKGYLCARCEAVGVDPDDVKAHNAGQLSEPVRAAIEAIMTQAALRLRLTVPEGNA